jgi:hypothetical protein
MIQVTGQSQYQVPIRNKNIFTWRFLKLPMYKAEFFLLPFKNLFVPFPPGLIILINYTSIHSITKTRNLCLIMNLSFSSSLLINQ